MEIVHINSYYITRPLHSYLITEIDKIVDSQIIYIPIHDMVFENKFKVDDLKNTKYTYSKVFLFVWRYLWPLKILAIWIDFKKRIQNVVSHRLLIHAHSLFVNGSIAYLSKKKFHINYVITIRNTDFNVFLKRSVLFRKLGYRILKNASGIVFLSPVYKDEHLNSVLGEQKYNELKHKCFVVPNGLNSFWFNRGYKGKLASNGQINIIFVGTINKNKNLVTLIAACELLNKTNKCYLKVIGDGPCLKAIKRKTVNFKIDFYGTIDDLDKLRHFYIDSDIFVLPSLYETFGLVYIEAMSQGLPVIYSAKQGIDGYFEPGYLGYSVNPLDPNDIQEKIRLIVADYPRLSENAYLESQKFTWNNTAQKLVSIYNHSFGQA